MLLRAREQRGQMPWCSDGSWIGLGGGRVVGWLVADVDLNIVERNGENPFIFNL